MLSGRRSADRQRQRWLSAALGIALAAGSARADGPPITFSALARGERITVEVLSQGCFHRDSFQISVERAPAADQPSRAAVLTSRSRTGTPLAPLPLSAADLQALDRLLARYRRPTRHGCTTVDTVAVSYWRGSRLLGRERHTDDSCSLDQDPGTPSFPAWWRRAGGA